MARKARASVHESNRSLSHVAGTSSRASRPTRASRSSAPKKTPASMPPSQPPTEAKRAGTCVKASRPSPRARDVPWLEARGARNATVATMANAAAMAASVPSRGMVRSCRWLESVVVTPVASKAGRMPARRAAVTNDASSASTSTAARASRPPALPSCRLAHTASPVRSRSAATEANPMMAWEPLRVPRSARAVATTTTPSVARTASGPADKSRNSRAGSSYQDSEKDRTKKRAAQPASTASSAARASAPMAATAPTDFQGPGPTASTTLRRRNWPRAPSPSTTGKATTNRPRTAKPRNQAPSAASP